MKATQCAQLLLCFVGRSECQTFLQLFRVWKGLVSSYSWGLKCWFPMEIRQIMPQTIDDQPQAVRFHRRFDFNDAMHHRMLRTMYCKLARCKAGIAVFNARCNFVWTYLLRFPAVDACWLDFHFSFLHFLDPQVLRPVGTWGMPSCRKSLGGQTGMVGSSLGTICSLIHYPPGNEHIPLPIISTPNSGFHYPGNQHKTLSITFESMFCLKTKVGYAWVC